MEGDLLRWLVLDLNSFFASCEQQEHPEEPTADRRADDDGDHLRHRRELRCKSLGHQNRDAGL
jgi:hypothetical protein